MIRPVLKLKHVGSHGMARRDCRCACAWLTGAATVILSWQAQGDEPKKKHQIVSPRDVGINATGINGRGDVVGFEWIASKKYPGVIEQVPFFASGKTITYLTAPEGYTAFFPAAVSDDGVVVGHAGKPAPRGRSRCGTRRSSGIRRLECTGLACWPTTWFRMPATSQPTPGASAGIPSARIGYGPASGTGTAGWKGAALPHDSN